MSLLVVESNVVVQTILVEALADHDLKIASNASKAIEQANDMGTIDAVILDLSLGEHSGMEFIYEFRTYCDWQDVPIIVYSSLQLSDEVRASRAWQQLNITAYLYKPQSDLGQLKALVAS